MMSTKSRSLLLKSVSPLSYHHVSINHLKMSSYIVSKYHIPSVHPMSISLTLLDHVQARRNRRPGSSVCISCPYSIFEIHYTNISNVF
jgi:hypothetical protein